MVKHAKEDENLRQRTLTCDWCLQVFAYKSTLDRHVKSRCPCDPSKSAMNVQNVDSCVQNVDSSVQNVDSPVQNVDRSVSNVDPPQVTSHARSAKYPCPTCFRIFNRPSKLEAHVSNCKGVSNILECHKCHQVFASSSSKSHHMKRCTAEEPVTQPQVVNNNTSQVINANNSFNNTTNIQNQVNNNQVNNTQIVINGLGNEFKGHLTPEFLALQASLKHGKGIVNCIEKVHFNPEIPQNQNMRLIANPNTPQSVIAVYDNDKWILRDYRNTMIKVIQNFCGLLKDRVRQTDFMRKEDTWNDIFTRLCEFTIDDNPNDFYATLREVKLLMQNVEKVMI